MMKIKNIIVSWKLLMIFIKKNIPKFSKIQIAPRTFNLLTNDNNIVHHTKSSLKCIVIFSVANKFLCDVI